MTESPGSVTGHWTGSLETRIGPGRGDLGQGRVKSSEISIVIMTEARTVTGLMTGRLTEVIGSETGCTLLM